MLTRNFMYMLGQSTGMNCDNTPLPIGTDGAKLTSPFYNYISFGSASSMSAFPFNNECWKYSRFALGTGTTKEKSTDYHVESEVDGNIDCSTLTKRYIQGTDQDHINISGVMTNNGTTAFTFSEVGWYVSYTGNNEKPEIMLAREVLTEPITIEPGQSVAVNVRLM